MNAPEIGILEKRRAQAEVIKPIYEVLKAEFGVEKAQQIIGESVRKAAIEEGQRFAAAQPCGPNLQRFAELQPLWIRGDALNLTVLVQTDNEFDYNVTRCRYAEMYHEMGLGEIGHLLSCQRDGSFCEGFDPRIKLTRTQTLMQGASHCDFRFRFSEEQV